MKAYFDTSERVQLLEQEAKRWMGTPFYPNAQICGEGVSCQKLAPALYIGVGFLPSNFESPNGPMDWAQQWSRIEEFVDRLQMFKAVNDGRVMAGDLLGFRVHRSVHHLGVALSNDRFMHCLREPGAHVCRLDDATWSSRLERIWRPMEV